MFWRKRQTGDFSAEVEAHLAIEADRLRAEGIGASDAQAAARKAFGNPSLVREGFYDSRRALWWDNLCRDLRYALRGLRKSPTFTATAIVTLALGIGANTALFSVIDTILLKPLPYPHPAQLVVLHGRTEQGVSSGPSPADFLDYRRAAHSFQKLAGVRELPFNLTTGVRPQRVEGAVVTPDFFAVLKIPAQLGRTFLSGVDQPGARLIVLSDSLWRNEYAAEPSIVGRPIQVDGELFTVTGVMPPRFQFPLECRAWKLSRFAVIEQPLAPFVDPSNSRDAHYFDTIGRLKSGVTRLRAQAETDTIARRLKKQFGEQEEAIGSVVVDLHEDLVGETRPVLLALLAGVGLLLLIACANVANVLLARGTARQREIAVRAALGAARSRIVGQLMAESLLLSTAGGCAGIVLTLFALGPLRALTPPELLLGVAPALDGRVLLFTFLLSLASGLLFGILPALQSSRADLNIVLKEGARGTTHGARAGRAQSALMIAEIAFATVLLIGAGLLIRSFLHLLGAPEGFRPANVLSVELSFSPARYPSSNDRAVFVKQALERIRDFPGIESAAVISRLPLNRGNSTRGLSLKGSARFPADDAEVDYLAASPDYFHTLAVPVIKGRVFTEQDTASSAPVIVVNEAAARRLWPDQDPLAGLVRVGGCGEADQWCQVVGVVGDIRQHSLAKSPVPAVYVPYARDPWPFLAFVIHSRIDPLDAASGVQAAIHAIDKDLPLFHVRTMQDVVSNSLAARRFNVILLGLFAALALLLGCIGIYGVMAYAVAQRSAEIGIRMALGAAPGKVLLLVVGAGLRRAIAGVLVGMLCSLWANRLLASSLYGVRPADALTLAAAFTVFVAVATIATYLPARRATLIDPVQALRAE